MCAVPESEAEHNRVAERVANELLELASDTWWYDLANELQRHADALRASRVG